MNLASYQPGLAPPFFPIVPPTHIEYLLGTSEERDYDKYYNPRWNYYDDSEDSEDDDDDYYRRGRRRYGRWWY